MKKKIYTVLTIILCLTLVFYLYEVAQINYIIWVVPRGDAPQYLYLFDIAWGVASIGAIIGGYFLSKVWWRIVYIEKRHRHNIFKK